MVEGLTVEELARLKAIATEATPGPWSDFDSKAYEGDPDDGDAYVFVTTADGCTGEIAAHMLDVDARYVAAFDPPTALALITQVERLTAERDEARLSIGASDAANQLGGLVGASAHDLHLEMERRLAERAVKWKARADTLAAENERLRTALKGVLPYMEEAEERGLVGDEGAHWPVELVRTALAAGEPAR